MKDVKRGLLDRGIGSWGSGSPLCFLIPYFALIAEPRKLVVRVNGKVYQKQRLHDYV